MPSAALATTSASALRASLRRMGISTRQFRPQSTSSRPEPEDSAAASPPLARVTSEDDLGRARQLKARRLERSSIDVDSLARQAGGNQRNEFPTKKLELQKNVFSSFSAAALAMGTDLSDINDSREDLPAVARNLFVKKIDPR